MTIPREVVEAVYERATDERGRVRCEACTWILREFGGVLHHRQLRSRGGPDTVENLILIHPQCHKMIHDHPDLAQHLGLMVSAQDDPAQIEVQPRADLLVLTAGKLLGGVDELRPRS